MQIDLNTISKLLSTIDGFNHKDIEPSMKLSDFFPQDGYSAYASYIEFLDALENNYSVSFREDDIWFYKTISEWIKQINRMINENQFIESGEIDWNLLEEFFIKVDGFHIDISVLTGTVADFCSYVSNKERNNDVSKISIILMPFIDAHYLTFTEDDLDSLDREEEMTDVYAIMTEKLRERKSNDCRVFYGNNYSLKSRMQTVLKLEQVPGYPEGMLMKKINGVNGVISRKGMTLPDGTRPKPQKGYYTLKSDNLYQNFNSIQSMLDAGWIID